MIEEILKLTDSKYGYMNTVLYENKKLIGQQLEVL